jgi:hypothetical protein
MMLGRCAALRYGGGSVTARLQLAQQSGIFCRLPLKSRQATGDAQPATLQPALIACTITSGSLAECFIKQSTFRTVLHIATQGNCCPLVQSKAAV